LAATIPIFFNLGNWQSSKDQLGVKKVDSFFTVFFHPFPIDQTWCEISYHQKVFSADILIGNFWRLEEKFMGQL
jgi:hypothetical protein